MLITLFAISLIGGFLSGLLGLGGAVIIIPLMLTIPPFLNVGSLSMKTISGLSMVQILFSSCSGIIVHRKNCLVHVPTLLCIGIPMGISSLIGSYFSKYLTNNTVLIVFGLMILTAIIILLFCDQKNEDTKILKTNKKLSIIIGSIVGMLSGIVGAGGGFILIPIINKFLKLPLKNTIGTSLGIVFIGAFSGALGKILSLQVNYSYLLPVIMGSLISAQLGARVCKKTSPKVLKYSLFTMISISLIQILIKLF